MNQYRIRRLKDGMFFGTKEYGKSHSKNGKFYRTLGHAKSAVKGGDLRPGEHEIVVYELKEVSTISLKRKKK